MVSDSSSVSSLQSLTAVRGPVRGPSWRSEGQMLTVAWILMSVVSSHSFFPQTHWFLPTTKLYLQLNASFATEFQLLYWVTNQLPGEAQRLKEE